MIHYRYKKPKILFVGINPHFGSFDRGVPFSNNKLFWYLLSEAGIIEEKRDFLRNDEELKCMYTEKFNEVYGLGLVNIISRPTQDVTKLIKGEEEPGRKKISRIIKSETPKVACFIGKVTYEKYIGSKNFSFGWQDSIGDSRIFVMHFPLRGKAIIRVRELMEVAEVARGLNETNTSPTSSRAMNKQRCVMRVENFKIGDHVIWNSEAGRVSGKIIKVHKKNVEYKGYTHHASKDEPQYEIMSDKTDHIAMHKGTALKKVLG